MMRLLICRYPDQIRSKTIIIIFFQLIFAKHVFISGLEVLYSKMKWIKKIETDLKLTAEKNMIMLINYYFPLFCIVILLYLQFAEFSEKLFCFGSKFRNIFYRGTYMTRTMYMCNIYSTYYIADFSSSILYTVCTCCKYTYIQLSANSKNNRKPVLLTIKK